MFKTIQRTMLAFIVIAFTSPILVSATDFHGFCTNPTVQGSALAAKFVAELVAIETMAAQSETGVTVNTLSKLISELTDLGIIGATAKIQYYDKAVTDGKLNREFAGRQKLSKSFTITDVAGSHLLVAAATQTFHNIYQTYRKFKKTSAIASYHQDKKVAHYINGKKNGQRLWLLANYALPLIGYLINNNYIKNNENDFSKDTKSKVDNAFIGLVGLAIISEMMRTRIRHRLESATPRDPLSVPTHVIETKDEIE